MLGDAYEYLIGKFASGAAGRARHAQLRENSEEIRDVLDGTLEPEELAIVQKALDRIAEAFST